jgi:nicotinate dehydrogenase subunit B
MSVLPINLQTDPRLSSWITVHRDGTFDVRCGKVELGQGIHTALAQIVAEELDIEPDRIRMMPVTTGLSPDEGLTAGSRSIEGSGAALRTVGAEVRALFVAAAADRLGVPATELDINDGVIAADGKGVGYWDLVDAVTLDVEATGLAQPKSPADYRVVGTNASRTDLPDKVTGQPRFIHDLTLPGLLYGRVVRPPSPGAILREVDTAPAKALPGVVEIVRDGSFLGIIASQEETALTGADILRQNGVWDEHTKLPDMDNLRDFLLSGPFATETLAESPPTAEKSARTMAAVYTRPYLAHASMAPSCALARWQDGKLEAWTHSQGIYNLRVALSETFPALTTDQVTVHHAEGAGCYGHNGADDVAFDAALLAAAVPGRPVQVVWSRQDELGWAPFGPAMAVRLSADVAEDGGIVAWRHETYGNGHVSRPVTSGAPSLLGASHTSNPVALPVAGDPPLPRGGGGQRNAVPLYEFPSQQVVYNRVLKMPLRTSALRALGAFMNIFAIESFMDELAQASEVDPVEFRLRYLRDERARAVIEAVAERAGWASRQPTESRGYGFAFARYSNKAAYCAVVAEVLAENEVRVEKLTLAVDAGLVVNPDGLVNQVEGGAVQSTSWTLKEQVRFDRTRVTSTDWESYPILRFSEVPRIDVVLVNRPQYPSLGAGECAQGPVAAAIANALHDALGIRVRDLPLTYERVVAAID